MQMVDGFGDPKLFYVIPLVLYNNYSSVILVCMVMLKKQTTPVWNTVGGFLPVLLMCWRHLVVIFAKVLLFGCWILLSLSPRTSYVQSRWSLWCFCCCLLSQSWVSGSEPCSEWEDILKPQLWERTESWIPGPPLCCEYCFTCMAWILVILQH